MQLPPLQVDFLLWLDRYVGTWECDGQRYVVPRRHDGWLKARGPDHKETPLTPLFANGKRISPAQSPLGMYPVMLSANLMELWLKPDEMKRLRNAWGVGPGQKLILEAIEQNIRESDESTRRRKFEKMWLAGRGYNDPWTDDDSQVYDKLRAEYEAETSKH